MSHIALQANGVLGSTTVLGDEETIVDGAGAQMTEVGVVPVEAGEREQ